MKKYEPLIDNFARAGAFTPYYRGRLLGDTDANAADEPRFVPFIWLPPESGKGRRIAMTETRNKKHWTELELTGDDKTETAWTSRTVPVEPGRLYRLSVFVTSKSDGRFTIGVNGATRTWDDIKPLPKKEYEFDKPKPPRRSLLFLGPRNEDSVQARLGPGKSGRTYHVSDVYLEPVLPIHRGLRSAVSPEVKTFAATSSFVGLPGGKPNNAQHHGGDFLRLGDGESIDGETYRFEAAFGDNGLYHRPLESATASFDTDRIVFGHGEETTYRFELRPIRLDDTPGQFTPPPLRFRTLRWKMRVRDHMNDENWVNGEQFQTPPEWLHWSTDGETWQTTPPSDAETVFVRISNISRDAFSMSRFSLEASVDSKDYSGEGKTVFAVLDRPRDRFGEKPPPEGCQTVPIMFGPNFELYKLMINETGQEQTYPCGNMDYFGGEDSVGGHGDGPGKWTIVSVGGRVSPVKPYRARISVWAYNWFGDANYFSFHYPGFTFRYEIRGGVRTPREPFPLD